MQTLNPNISQVEIANDRHEGVVRIHIERYLGETAQEKLTAIAARIKGASDATLLPDQQIIVLVASQRCNTEEQLRRLFNSFAAALNGWFDQLDELDLNFLGCRPDFTLAMAVNSATGFNGQPQE